MLSTVALRHRLPSSGAIGFTARTMRLPSGTSGTSQRAMTRSVGLPTDPVAALAMRQYIANAEVIKGCGRRNQPAKLETGTPKESAAIVPDPHVVEG